MSLRADVKAFVDGELSPERAAEFEAALQTDPSLAAEVEAMKSLTEHVRNLGRQPQPTGLDETLGRLAPARRFPAARLIWAGGALAAVVLVGLVGPQLTGFTPLGSKAGFAIAPGDASAVATKAEAEPSAAAEAAGGAEGDSVRKSSGSDPSADVPNEMRYRSGSDTPMAGARVQATPKDSAPPLPGTVIDPNRQVIRRADMGLSVKDAQLALADATRFAGAVGGYIESSGLQNLGNRPTASVVMRVPQTKFDATLSMLRGLGEVDTETLSGEDVTAQVADLDARVRALAGQEQQYLVLLRSARRIGEIMEIRDRLGEVRQELESLKAQAKSLKGLAAMSTVSATFVQKPSVDDPVKPADWSGRAWAEAVGALTTVGRVLVTGLIYVLVLAPVWLPIVIAAWWLRRRAK